MRNLQAGIITISFFNGLVMFGGDATGSSMSLRGASPDESGRTMKQSQSDKERDCFAALAMTKQDDGRRDTSDSPLFIKHTPRYFSLARLPYNYDKDAQCPRWRAFLDDVMEGDEERIELLQQWAGYLLTNTLKFQKFMLLAGEGGNGKTVFTTIMEKIVGEGNASHMPLCRFDDRFALTATLDKMLNTSSESSHKIDELCETMLKSYTSGDRMTFDRKNRDLISANPTAKVMISTNQLPNFTDKSNGIWRRMLCVFFGKNVPVEE